MFERNRSYVPLATKKYGYINNNNNLKNTTSPSISNSFSSSFKSSSSSISSSILKNNFNNSNSNLEEVDRLINDKRKSPIRNNITNNFSSQTQQIQQESLSLPQTHPTPGGSTIEPTIHFPDRILSITITAPQTIDSGSHSPFGLPPLPTPRAEPQQNGLSEPEIPDPRSKPVPLSNPIEVETNLQVFRVHKIDSSSEEFTIDCGITFIWKDPLLVEASGGKHYASHPAVVRHNPRTGRADYTKWPDDLIVGETVFDPAWKILNCSDLEIIKCFTQLLDASQGKVHNYLHIRATIYQTLDLHNFPFDHQKMTIRIQSEHSERVLKFVPMKDRKPCLFDNNIASEWNIDCKSIALLFPSNNTPAASGI